MPPRQELHAYGVELPALIDAHFVGRPGLPDRRHATADRTSRPPLPPTPASANIRKTPIDKLTVINYRLVVNQLDSTFAALSDPTRRAMVTKLTLGPASIHDLTEPFSLSQQMISKHVACLVRARIVVKQRRGRESICSLRPIAIKAVADWAFDFRRLWDESFDKLDEVLREMKKEETIRGKSSNR